MEYERIHKVQMEVISPSKLKIKLLGSCGGKRKERWNDSSPSKFEEEDMDDSDDSLLAADLNGGGGGGGDSSKANRDASPGDITTSSDVPTLELAIKERSLACGQDSQTPTFRNDCLPKRVRSVDHSASQSALKSVANLAQTASNVGTAHPLRSVGEGSHGYGSGHGNASSQSFEFHGGVRTSQHQAFSPFFRNLPSKWNDAEKWIVHRQMMHAASSASKKRNAHCQGSRRAGSGRATGIPGVTADQKHSNLNPQGAKMRRSSSSSSYSSTAEKLDLVTECSQSSLDTMSAASGVTDTSAVSSDYSSVPGKLCFPENHTIKSAVSHAAVQSVSMRDIGTEMTPIPSQEPSRTGTPLDAMTPSRSPWSSTPSSPRRGSAAPAPSPVKATNELKCKRILSEVKVSERELQMKTRREIAALGLQLSKMNIASWSSKDDSGQNSPTKTLDMEQASNSEYEARAAAWEEMQKFRYTARYKHEEVQIQAWESQQKVKYEAKMRRLEAQVEQMKAQAQEKMMEKLALARRRVEQKQATANARRKRQAARTSRQVEKIRRTGKIPASRHFCSWFIFG